MVGVPSSFPALIRPHSGLEGTGSRKGIGETSTDKKGRSQTSNRKRTGRLHPLAIYFLLFTSVNSLNVRGANQNCYREQGVPNGPPSKGSSLPIRGKTDLSDKTALPTD